MGGGGGGGGRGTPITLFRLSVFTMSTASALTLLFCTAANLEQDRGKLPSPVLQTDATFILIKLGTSIGLGTSHIMLRALRGADCTALLRYNCRTVKSCKCSCGENTSGCCFPRMTHEMDLTSM